MKNLKEYLSKNRNIVYWWRCFRNRNDKNFRRNVLNCEKKNLFWINDESGDLNKDKVYYDVCINGGHWGFFAIYRRFLHAAYVAKRFNMIPYYRVINSYYNNGNDNVYDCFFEQPSKKTYDEIMKSQNVVEYNMMHFLWFEDQRKADITTGYLMDNDNIKELAELKNSYIKLKPEINESIKQESSFIFGKNRVIGIHYRGTDFKAGFSDHPIPLEPCDYFKYIDECLKKGYKKIFVATDDNRALEEFKSKYEDKIVYYKDTIRSNNEFSVHMKKNSNKNEGFKKAYEVLRDMITLSKCDALICGNSQVTIASRIERESTGNPFDYIKIIDKGVNAIDKRNNYYKKLDSSK